MSRCERKKTEEEQIRAVFVDAAHAAEEKRVNDVMRAATWRRAALEDAVAGPRSAPSR